ncbi:LysR family transcriptional regulator [Kineococcus sp. SYSU DK003]|uniref:LysR family transcriptional regulator n=1 Tax=Kineococcus sp. SYSU DK003 TaxID=3383124 RepID=UPI003D7E8F22
MESRELRHFVAVAEELSFTRAAARLGMAQPPLSQSVARFERRLGTQLFVRGPRRNPSLTAAGRVLLREGRRILEALEEAEHLVRSLEQDVEPLRVGCIPSVMSGVMPQVVPQFQAERSRGGIYLYEIEEVQLLDDVRAGVVDVGICRLREEEQGLDVEVLLMEPLVCALPQAHPLTRLDAVPLAELAGEEFVIFRRDDAPRAYDAIVAACHFAGFSPRTSLRGVHDLSELAIIACGLAVALMPRCSTVVSMDGVVYRPLVEEFAVTPLALVRPAGARSAVVDEFAGLVREALGVAHGRSGTARSGRSS